MTGVTWRLARSMVCAAALITLSAGLVSAEPARVGTSTNLRQGPGTNFGVITTAPAGSVVDVIRCGPEWCNVTFRGRPGYMVARNIGMEGGPVGVAPRVVVVDPPPVVVYGGPGYYGPRYYGRGYYGRGYGYRGYGRW